MTVGAPKSEQFHVARQAPALGALIEGVDLAGGVDDDVVRALRAQLMESMVICIRGQEALSSEQQLAFAERWGDVTIFPFVPSIDGYPGIMEVFAAHPMTTTWHVDNTHAKQPPALTMLLAKTVPAMGADTMFANAALAFERLSEGMRRCLSGLRAVHERKGGPDGGAVLNVHPVVRLHPETGRRSLFVNGNYTTRFDGWTAEESEPLLSFLYRHIARYEFTYRHRWQVGDLLIWDNRCVQHAVIGDVGDVPRLLHRVLIAGDVPRDEDREQSTS